MFTGRQEVMDPIQVAVMFHEFEFFAQPWRPPSGRYPGKARIHTTMPA
jgi:hypothetical protein